MISPIGVAAATVFNGTAYFAPVRSTSSTVSHTVIMWEIAAND